jgi:hypothetical protein
MTVPSHDDRVRAQFRRQADTFTDTGFATQEADPGSGAQPPLEICPHPGGLIVPMESPSRPIGGPEWAAGG